MTHLTLGSDMGAPTEADWLQIVETALRGQSADTLISREADGLIRQPLYTEARNPTASDPSGLPGFAPYIRGTTAVTNRFQPWQIAQRVVVGRDGSDNEHILADLAGGVSALLLDAGNTTLTKKKLDKLLHGVDLDIAPLALATSASMHNVEALLAFLDERKVVGDAVGFLNLDPQATRLHTAENDFDMAALLKTTAAHPGLRLLTAAGTIWHSEGAGTAQELGWTLAGLVQHLRDGETAGATPKQALPRMTMTLAAETDFFVTLSKIRAARLLYANIAEAVGVIDAQDCVPQIHTETSLRAFSSIDPWVNIVRATLAAMGAALAGVDWLTVAPCSASSAGDNTLTRRIARNTQVILQEESHIGHVVDAAGGSWYVEQLTRDLAVAGWGEFQKIEAAGGLAKVLDGQMLHDALAAAREAMQTDVNHGALPLIGVSEFPNLEEAPLPAGDDSKFFEGFRLAAPFEKLRRAAQKAKPKVFQACIGDRAAFMPRSNFASNLYAAGGLHTIAGDGGTDMAAIAAAFKKSTAKIAVICGSDADYETHAAPLADTLRKAGVTHLALAGKPRPIKNIDAYCFVGGPTLEFLNNVHGALGLEEHK